MEGLRQLKTSSSPSEIGEDEFLKRLGTEEAEPLGENI